MIFWGDCDTVMTVSEIGLETEDIYFLQQRSIVAREVNPFYGRYGLD